jgi:pre-mRNA-splicing factor CWC22
MPVPPSKASEPKGQMLPVTQGNVYMPPYKMRAMLEKLKQESQETEAHQKYMWESLRKSLNGIVNKVNVSNISNIVMELFNENLMRGKGLLIKSIMKAQ